MDLLNYIQRKLFTGHERSVRAKKSIIILSLLKSYSLFLSFLLVPLTLKILNDFQYGIWITIFNILSWISILDIGIGNGLRNKFVYTMSRGDINETREYVSTAYFTMAVISILLILIFITPWFSLDWSKIFNVPDTFKYELFNLIGIVTILSLFNFVFSLIGVIFTALHKPTLSVLLGAISNSIVLIVLYLFSENLSYNLLAVGLIYTTVPLVVFILATFIFFKYYYSNISPSFLYFKKSKVKSLVELGSQFFIIQIAVVIIFSTDSLIISHVLSPKEVTNYNIVLRYFSVFNFAMGIFMTPLWSLYTEAAEKKDFIWIKIILKKQINLLFYIFILIIIFLISANKIISIWLNNEVELSDSLLIGAAIFTFISIWNNIFSYILNGLSITKMQTITALCGAVINIPLSIYFAKFWGSSGVIFASSISLSFFAIFGFSQTIFILKKNIGESTG